MSGTLDEIDSVGLTPLMWAARSGKVAEVRALLAAGADPNALGKGGHTALTWTFREGFGPYNHWPELRRASIAVREELLRAGADLALGYNPLMWAAEHGRTPALEVVIRLGIDVDARWEGRTALHLAAKEGFAAVARRLIRTGADVNATDESGRTPLDLALLREPSVERFWNFGIKADWRGLQNLLVAAGAQRGSAIPE